ncbi:Os02g0118900 [Oryza sativa Japonica Group]|jgi:hypothetical protein|uniref:Os02g0118900 protein n=1 Tax=Oryza sativa subsp. japonica TaxID=39947 RepID=Q0E4H8_ORYSJ|nr:Os02g0118900 [Oryza sativa Japonica Group]|eukprot:NP_001045696.2 Os02g0118900 [Oryza sativa Japonica Group]
MNQNISWVMDGKKRKREEEEEPTHSVMLPPEVKHGISERINGIVNHLRIRGNPVQGVLQLEILRQIALPKQSQNGPRKSRLTISLMTEHKVYGRDAERDNIIELLTKGKSSDLDVVPLVGVGGVGKTTLARFVYNNNRIENHFDLRMWVCVSDNFNEKSLTCEMLDHVCKDRQEYGNISNFDALQKILLEKIRHKRFLLVLDDMWEDRDRKGWENLLAPLKCNEATGCMILVTTRRTSVARMTGTMSKIDVNGLDETEFWSLFKAWAFLGNENQERDPTLRSIGQHIAEALKGNPLAARSVGALLNWNVSFEHWRKIQYKWRSILEQDDDILAILKLSYEFLPVHLQYCFSYCSLFPKDHKFCGKKLVRAWISQNFVKCECHTKRLEEIGKQYLDKLVDWGFLEEVESHYVMHDLMHDLAEKVSSNEYATVDGLESKKISPGVRHLSIITTSYDKEEHCNFPSEKFEKIIQNIRSLQKLRTLMFFGQNNTMLLRFLHTLCKESKRLRLLRIYLCDTFRHQLYT